jgi:hypothetical protein
MDHSAGFVACAARMCIVLEADLALPLFAMSDVVRLRLQAKRLDGRRRAFKMVRTVLLAHSSITYDTIRHMFGGQAQA